ncbi:MAG: SDR family oxidoreductase [Gammaproteobacteria bacterium]|nr:SDR family oxidoreductase [Gammaproteobacteria bacterium]
MTKPLIIVTGSSSGIGRAITLRLLQSNYPVIGIARYRHHAPLEHHNFISVPMDLADVDTLPEKLNELVDCYPDVQGIVFAAGRGQFGSLEEFSFSQIKSLTDLNFISQAYLAKAYLPLFKKRGNGHLIFIGSEAALKGSRKGAIYCASKFALRGLAQALRDECSKSNVRVTLVNPGMVNTAFYDELDFAPGKEPENYLVPEDVALTIDYILSTRAVLSVDEINLSPLKNVVQSRKKTKQ